jgi:CBS domain containing-hemolysin-like protein
LPDGRIRAPGLTHLDELEPLIGIHLPGNAATVAGLVLHTLGRLPVVGDRIVVEGFEIEVEAVMKNAVSSVLLKPRPENESPRQDSEAS